MIDVFMENLGLCVSKPADLSKGRVIWLVVKMLHLCEDRCQTLDYSMRQQTRWLECGESVRSLCKSASLI